MGSEEVAWGFIESSLKNLQGWRMHNLFGKPLLQKTHPASGLAEEIQFFCSPQKLQIHYIFVKEHFLVEDFKRVAVYKLSLSSNVWFPKAVLLQTLDNPHSLMCARSCLRGPAIMLQPHLDQFYCIFQSRKPMRIEVCDLHAGCVKSQKKYASFHSLPSVPFSTFSLWLPKQTSVLVCS